MTRSGQSKSTRKVSKNYSQKISTESVLPSKKIVKKVKKAPNSPTKTLLQRAERKLKDDGVVRIEYTMAYEINTDEYNDFVEHLEECQEIKSLVIHWDLWGLKWHLENLGHPTEIKYSVKSKKT